MNDAEYEATKARILTIFNRWQGPLGLRWWRVNLVWDREHDTAHSDSDLGGNVVSMCCAVTTVSWAYLEATITWFVPACAELDDERIEYIVLHEMAHILVNEMRWADENAGPHNMAHEERVCTGLGHAFQWVRDFALKGELSPALEVSNG